MTDDTRFYIDGAWVDRPAAPRIAVTNPWTEETIGHIAAGSPADVDLAVAAARRAFDGFSQWPVADRLALLERIRDLLEERTEQFAQAITAEMGAAIAFSRAGQVHFGIEHVRAAIEVLRTSNSRARSTASTSRKRADRRGRALITPWNWPLYQITAKLAPALAAGCTVVLKPSELSPFSALLFAQVMHDAGAPPGVFNLVNGTGEVVGAAMSAHPRRRHGLVHRLDPRGHAGGAGRRADGQAGGAGTRRQVAQRVPARCRFRRRGAQGRARGDAQCRPVVRRADADGRAARAPRRSRGAGGRGGGGIVVGDPLRRGERSSARWPTSRSSPKCRS